MSEKCSCGKDCITTKENIQEKISKLYPCDNCVDISIKKFTALKKYDEYDEINSNYYLCSCGKRPLDVVMGHILKIMIEKKIVPEKASLRRNSPIPLPSFYHSSENPQFIGEDSLILIHPDLTKEIAKKIINEVDEVKGIIKGEGTIGILDKKSEINEYELLAGCDVRSDICRTLIPSEKIIINKKQSISHIEVAPTTEQKLVKLYNYLENSKKYNENPENFTALDGMCGCGALGIFLLKYGFKNVIFNDIYDKACETTKLNLEINELESEVLNVAFEDLEVEKVDLCIIDGYPGVDIEKIIEKAEEIADDVLIT